MIITAHATWMDKSSKVSLQGGLRHIHVKKKVITIWSFIVLLKFGNWKNNNNNVWNVHFFSVLFSSKIFFSCFFFFLVLHHVLGMQIIN